MTTMKHLISSAAAKLVALTFGFAALCASTVHAAGFDGKSLTTNDWFDVGFSGVVANTPITAGSTTGITLGAGSWTAVPTSGEAVVLSDKTLSIDADSDEALTLTPVASLETGMETVSVKIKANVSTSLETPTDSPITAFALYNDGTSVKPVAYVSGAWKDLVYAPGAANLTNAWFTLYIDYADVDNVKSVRFSVQPDGGAITVLKDSENVTWFASGSSSAAKISSLSFCGSGLCQTISGDCYSNAVAQVNGVNYATFAEAITAADAAGVSTITILNGAAVSPNADWKVVNGQLVKKVYVAQIGANKYETLDEAFSAANATAGSELVTIMILNASVTSAGATITRDLLIDTELVGGATITFDAYADFITQGGATVTFADDVAAVGNVCFAVNQDTNSKLVLNNSVSAYYLMVNKAASEITLNPSARVYLDASEGVIYLATGSIVVNGDLAAGSALTATTADVSGNQQLIRGYFRCWGGSNVVKLNDTFVSTVWVERGGGNADFFLTNSVLYITHNVPSEVTNKGFDMGGYGEVTLSGSRIIANAAPVVLNSGDVANLDATSSITAWTWTNNGVVNVDVSGLNLADNEKHTIVSVTGNGAVTPGTINLTNVPSGKSYDVEVDGKNIVLVKSQPPVAQIVGGDTYTTLQAALEAAYAMTGDVTVKLLADASEKAVVWQKAGLNLTIDGDDNTLTGQLIVFGLGNDSTRTETLTIKNFNFTGANDKSDFYSGSDAFVFFPNGTFSSLAPGGYSGVTTHAHNVTITDCAFAATGESVVDNLKAVAIKSLSTGLDSIKLVDLEVSNVHSIQFFAVGEAEITGLNLAHTKNGVNFNFTEGDGIATIRNSSICPEEAEAYGVRIQGPEHGIINLEEGTIISAYSAFETGNTSAQTVSSDGAINVKAGSYKGRFTFSNGAYNIVVTGGMFDNDPSAYLPEGYEAVALAQDSAEYAAGYRYVVGVVSTYVAQIIRDNGATTNMFTTLDEVFAANNNVNTVLQPGDIVELLTDVVWDGASGSSYYLLNVDGSVTIDGKGHTLSAPVSGGPSDSAIMLGDSSSGTTLNVYTITNMTFSGFSENSHSVIRCQAVTANIIDCTFTNNTIEGSEWGVVTGERGVFLNVKDCVFRGNNIATKCIDFGFNNTGGNDEGTMVVDGCLFENNRITDSGVIYVAPNTVSATIRNSTFTGNEISASGAAAVYCSYPATITGNLFTNNTVTASSKEGVIVLGGSAGGTAITENAFVDNHLSTDYSKRGTVFTGADCNLAGNYWGNGTAPVAGTDAGDDVYLKDSPTVTVPTYATAYAVNESGNGVTVTLYVPPVVVDYVTLSLTIDADYAATYPENVAAARAMYEGKKYTSLAEAQAAFASLFGWTGTGYANPNNAPFKNAVASNGPTPVTKVTFDLYGTTAVGTSNGKITLGNFSDSSLYLMSVDLVGHDGAEISGEAEISAKVAGGYDNHHTTRGKFFVTNIVFTTSSDKVEFYASCANIGATEKVVEPSELEVVGCTFHTKVYEYSNSADNGKMTYSFHDNVFISTGSETYALHIQSGEDMGPDTINFYNNIVSNYVRGININVSSSTQTKTANIYGNTFYPGVGYSAVQLSTIDVAFVTNNVIYLDAGNAITLHENLNDGAVVHLDGNTIAFADGASVGYIVYDDAYAGNNADALARNLTMTYTDNTVAEGISTTQGVKGANAYGLREYVYNVLNPATYVAQIGTAKYESLAAAIAAVPTDGTKTTITMIDNDTLEKETTLSISNNKNIVLDLNGKTISGSSDLSGANVYFLMVNTGCALTVKDTSEGAAGKISFASSVMDFDKERVTVKNIGGTLTLESGTIENTTGGGMAYAVNNAVNCGGSSTFVMTGGTISSVGGDGDLRIYNNAVTTAVCRNNVTISGGTLASTGIFCDVYLGNIPANYTGENVSTTLNITGGTINGLVDFKIRHKYNNNFTISGGDFTNAKMWVRKYASEYKGDEPTDPMVYISGGKFAFVTGKAFGLSYDCGATSWTSYEKPYAVSGGVFNVTVPGTACASGYEVADTKDMDLKAAYPYTVREKAAELTITVTATDDTGATPQTVDVVKPIAVADSFFKDKIKDETTGAVVENPTVEQKQAYIAAKEDNGIAAWQNYVMGVDGTEKKNDLTPVAGEPTDTGVVVVKTPIETFTPPTGDIGVTVKYVLKYRKAGTDANDPSVWKAYGDYLSEPVFDVNVLTLTDDETYWKIEAVFTTTGETQSGN